MSEDLSAANVNRMYSLAATCIAILTFMLIFLYPRYANGQVDPLLFQATLTVMVLATFSFVFATLQYYGSARAKDEGQRSRYARSGDRFWLLGYAMLFLAPGLVLVSVALPTVAAVWFVLWLINLSYAVRRFGELGTRS